ncbi:TRAP transporter small permease [Alkalihalobacillus sp. TS-13]|uniref:TRAP transporter small permease n=1 Tax=Alkalihalobacillus sp. TS-13 TaxID=2842455 RepID=UPI001C87838A|nr:TRAP transporter small permease [Alkalihalobacillus sp. TS-13]
MNKLSRFFNVLLDLMASIGKSILVIIGLLIIIDVLTSNLLNRSIPWVLEVTEYLLVFLTFLGAAWLLREGGHIHFDLVLNHVPDRLKNLFGLISSLIGFGISLVITVFGFLATLEMYVKGVHTDAILQIPRYLLIVIIPIGFMLLSVQFLRNLMTFLPKIGIRSRM